MAVLLALPWLAAGFIKSDAGMVMVVALLLCVNPVYFVLTGALAGKDVGRLCTLPVLGAACFLLGMGLFFDSRWTVFLHAAGRYIAISYLSMGVAVTVYEKWRK